MQQQQFNAYQHYSQAAANAERAGDCDQALTYWQKAEDHAPNDKEKDWCNHRVCFLHQWGKRIKQRMAQEKEQPQC